MPCCSRMIGTTPFSVGSILDFLRVGASTNWWVFGCPSHCGPSVVHSLILAFIAGLGFGLSIGLLAIPLLAIRLGFVLSVIPHRPFSADPRPHRPPSLLASRHTCMSDSDLNFLREQICQLSIRVTTLEPQVSDLRNSGHHGSTADFELVSEVQRPRGTGTGSSSSVSNQLATEIPSCPPAGIHLCTSLKGGKLSFKDWAERAWSAGNWAKFVLQGRISKPRPTTLIDLANSVYVILRAKGITQPVRAERASDYRALVGDFTGESLPHSCV